MIGTKEKAVTRVTLEFLNSVILLFEKFLLMFQKGSQLVIYCMTAFVTY